MTHLVDHSPGTLRRGIKLPATDQVALARFVQHGLPERLASCEAGLLIASLMLIARPWSVRLRRGHVGLADDLDYEQEIALIILLRLPHYEPDRASLATWIKPWIRRTTQRVLTALAPGYPRPHCAELETQRFMAAVHHPAWPTAGLPDRLLMAHEAVGRFVTQEQVLAYLRLAEGTSLLSVVAEDVAEAASPVTAAPHHLPDDGLLDLLDSDAIRKTLASLTPRKRARLASLIGLDDRPPLRQVDIARAIGVTPQAVGETIRHSRAVRNRAAVANLGVEVVAANEEQRRPRQRVRRPPAKRGQP